MAEIQKIGDIHGVGLDFLNWICEVLDNKGLLYEIIVEGTFCEFNINVYETK